MKSPITVSTGVGVTALPQLSTRNKSRSHMQLIKLYYLSFSLSLFVHDISYTKLTIIATTIITTTTLFASFIAVNNHYLTINMHFMA